MAFHEDLRNHRLKKGLILEEISEDTKINVRILQALEQGDFHILPVPYVRLFMKAYAQAIDYPVEDILRGLENELKLTGEQGVSANISLETASSMDMTGAAASNVQNLLQAERRSQGNAVRLLIGVAILVVVIIFGKSLLKPNTPRGENHNHPLLPAMNLTQILDSLDFENILLANNSDNLTISSIDFLSIIHNDGSGNADTLFQGPSQSYTLILSDSSKVELYPSDAALLSVKGDTLPGSPFSNSWLVVTADSSSGHLKTYPTL